MKPCACVSIASSSAASATVSAIVLTVHSSGRLGQCQRFGSTCRASIDRLHARPQNGGWENRSLVTPKESRRGVPAIGKRWPTRQDLATRYVTRLGFRWARELWKWWFSEERVEHLIDGYRKAGLGVDGGEEAPAHPAAQTRRSFVGRQAEQHKLTARPDGDIVAAAVQIARLRQCTRQAVTEPMSSEGEAVSDR